MNEHCKRKDIKITDHAMQRMIERIGGEKNCREWQSYAKKARYDGISYYDLTNEQKNVFKSQVIFRTNSEQIRLYNGFWFIFRGNNGHSRTLITVFKYGDDRCDV